MLKKGKSGKKWLKLCKKKKKNKKYKKKVAFQNEIISSYFHFINILLML